MRELLLKAWMRPLVVGPSLWLGACDGSGATMRWLSRSIQDRTKTPSQLNFEIEDDRLVVVPMGSLAHPPCTSRDRSWHEAVERVRGGARTAAARQ